MHNTAHHHFPIAAMGIAIAAALPALAMDTPNLKQALTQVAPQHPRLFFSGEQTAGLQAKITADPLLKAVFDRIQARAEDDQKRNPIKREKVGKRLLGVSRTCLERVAYQAFTYRITGAEAYLRGAEREMLAAAAFEDWNPSHFLDVAEMTAALAIGYDWLFNELSPESRQTIRAAIIEKGLKTSLKGGWWVVTTNNWNQVCHGGLTMGALAVLEDAPKLAETIVARAIENVPRAMHEYEPDGVYPEGPSYWKYGTTYNVLLISALESALGSNFGLADAPGFNKTPEFYLHATGPTGLFFNFSDCGTRGGIAPAMHWFAARRNDPTLLWHEKKTLALFTTGEPGGSWDRLLPFLLIWGRPIGEIKAPAALHWKGGGRTPIAVHRSGWDPQATFLGIKGGSPSSNHAHMDTGSFVLDMAGVRWAVDLGAQNYHSLESRGVNLWGKNQDSERWTVFRLSNFSHNTLVAGGQRQRVKGHAPIINFSSDPSAPYTIVDITPAYEGLLKQARRGARLIGKSILVQDHIENLEQKTSVRWGMATHAKITINKNNTATLNQQGQTITLTVLSPENATLSVLDIEKPPREYDAENPNTRMIAFETELAPAAKETLAVFIQPAEDPAAPPPMTPLADWPQNR